MSACKLFIRSSLLAIKKAGERPLPVLHRPATAAAAGPRLESCAVQGSTVLTMRGAPVRRRCRGLR